jgi:hypothetical protein
MVPAVAEVIEIMDRLGAGLLNDIAEPSFAGIHGLVAVIVVGIRNPPTDLTSEELEEVPIIRPSGRRHPVWGPGITASPARRMRQGQHPAEHTIHLSHSGRPAS